MHLLFVLVGQVAVVALAETAGYTDITEEAESCSVFRQQAPYQCQPIAHSFIDSHEQVKAHVRSTDVLDDAFYALAVLQNTYFDPVNGTWPTSIDWTGAVIETVISGMLNTLSKTLNLEERALDRNDKEQLISSIFAHITHSFYGQNAAAILDEAYDDVLWVVLGWLETTKFIHQHATLYHPKRQQNCLSVPTNLDSAISTISWHGYRWACTFAQRARAFWDFATIGWDTNLCHGGMIWNPRLLPYKNAITNELWIAASISMYEYFPNDTFDDGWTSSKGFARNDPVYLAAAVEGYKWLRDVNMTNSQGLYVDGYHVDKSKPGNVECDQRDETVYTYNQGVILTGQRGLFTVTGSPSYLEEGHTLIQNVIKATGWDIHKNRPIDDIKDPRGGELPPMRGIGRYGIMEERCDAAGTCSRDTQSFKGIFFHHLTAFCAPIDPSESDRHAETNQNELSKVQAAHNKACRAYVGWLKHNVDAALETRDASGRFGMWWGASIFHQLSIPPAPVIANASDYRNKGTPLDRVWGSNLRWLPESQSRLTSQRHLAACQAQRLQPNSTFRHFVSSKLLGDPTENVSGQLARRDGDDNDRGRGRTVETQAGGLSLLRAYWEISHR